MKILIIMGGFFPGEKYGGPPVSVDNFCSLMNMYDCYIITQNHDMGDTEPYDNIEPGWNNRGNCKVWYLSDSEYNKVFFENIIMELNPDYLYLQGLFQKCIVPCLQLAKKHRLNVLLAPRGELCAGAFKKKYKKIPYIIVLRMAGLFRNIHFQSTVDEETLAIKKWLGATNDSVHLLPNIPSIPSIEFPLVEKAAGEAKLIFVSRIVSKKNLLYALQCLKQVKGRVKFDIYGPIEDTKYWEECKLAIDDLSDNIRVEYKGMVEHEKIHCTFATYDAFLFPTLSENFGHVIAESLMVGTPVIISDQTPFTDVNEYHAGKAIPLEEPLGFKDAIQWVINLNGTENIAIRNKTKLYVREKLDIQRIQNLYEDVFAKI